MYYLNCLRYLGYKMSAIVHSSCWMPPYQSKGHRVECNMDQLLKIVNRWSNVYYIWKSLAINFCEFFKVIFCHKFGDFFSLKIPGILYIAINLEIHNFAPSFNLRHVWGPLHLILEFVTPRKMAGKKEWQITSS